MNPNFFAVKLQMCTGVPGHDAVENPDFRGGEPSDTHQTLHLPGMDHGLEVDPVPVEELDEWIEICKVANRFFQRVYPSGLPEHPEVRIMDSDGHP